METKICIIAAVAQNGVIGANNKMPWHLPEDFKYFKNLTIGHPLIMGSKTFASLGKHLINRFHFVLTRQKSIKINGYRSNKNKELISPTNQIIGMLVGSKEEAINIINIKKEKLVENYNSDEIFVIGGGQIFKLFLPDVDKLYITRIDKDYAGDTKFPNWENLQESNPDFKNNFAKISEEKKQTESGLAYSFIQYEKIINQ